jgi:hypothetical protein
MKLKRAVELTERTVSNMLLSSGRPVFNEWMIVNLQGGQFELMHYKGPRSNASQKKISYDLRGIEDEMKRDGYLPGKFFFTPDAEGTVYDAFMVAGEKKFILFNNTLMKMTEITADPFWNKIQINFVELSEHFHSDALN